MSGNSRFAVSVHILAYLAYRQGVAVASAEIAASVDTNPVVIRRLLAALGQAGLVTARKGAGGGFTLAHPPKATTLLEIYRAIEPHPSCGLHHFAPNHRCPVGQRIGDILREVLTQAQTGMEATLAAVSLAEVHTRLQPVCPGRR